MSRRSHLIRNATIAALVGSTARPRIAASSASPATAAPAQSGQDPAVRDGLSNSIAVATRGVVPSTAPPASVRPDSAQNDSQKVVQRARALAEVPDVYALVALRESIGRRADERGEPESPATQELIREIERYLAEARRLRLKLDGEALRRDQAANPPRTGR